MRNLLAALLCLSLVCCADEKESANDQPDADTHGDAEAANARDTGEPIDDEDADNTSGPSDAGQSGDAARDGGVAMDGGSNRDSGMQPLRDAAAQDARTSTDAGTPVTESDASVGGAPRCAGSGLRFCDDFEDSIGPAWVDRDGTLEIDRTSPALRGQGSLHVHTVNKTPAIMAHRASFPMPNERFWTRMFVKIKNLPTAIWAHWSIMWTIPQGNQWSVEEHRAIGGQNRDDDKLYWAVGTDHGPSGDWTNIDTSSTVQLDKWICVETLIDATQEVSQVFRDGVEIPRLGTTRSVMHGGDTPNVPYDIPAVRTLWLGFIFYQGDMDNPNRAYDVWIDSFALDGERVGCTR